MAVLVDGEDHELLVRGRISIRERELVRRLHHFVEAIRTDSMREARFCVLRNVRLDAMPVITVVANALAIRTDRQQALELYRQFLKQFPDYPDLLAIYQKMLLLAQDLNLASEVEKIQDHIARLSPPQPDK